jgi:tRNA G46 methylase TrmB
VGCGHGASTIVMAQAYPNSEFFAFDYHKPSIERAKTLAQEAGVAAGKRTSISAGRFRRAAIQSNRTTLLQCSRSLKASDRRERMTIDGANVNI